MDMNNIKNNLILKTNRGILITKKFSPELMLGLGIIGVVTSTVLACKATLKVDQIKKENQEIIDKINHAKEEIDPKVYSEQDFKRDMGAAYVQGGIRYARLYLPAISLGALSISMLVGSHNILSKRNAAVVAAYKVLDSGFKTYRERVINQLGEDEDRYFMYGLPEKKIKTKVVDPETGKKVEIEEVVCDPPCMLIGNESVYARFFDSSSTQWRKKHDHNIYFLKMQQNYANDLLKSHGHLFLNEVYDMLGIPRSKEGAVVGWVYDSNGDNFVDFGIYNPVNELNRDYINRYEDQGLLLDFNVDGIIYDKI